MRDDQLRQLLRERNPWWRLAALGNNPAAWVDTDPTLTDAASVGIPYDPKILTDVAPPGIWVLRGPRRVGKSVTIKRLIARLCSDRTISPNQLIYFSADGFRSQDLRRAFSLGRDLAGTQISGPRFWFIDEVTSVGDWETVVKELRDNTPLAHDAIVLTGSSAVGLDRARRALGAGRTRNSNPFRVLLPMTFRSFVESTGVEIPPSEPVDLSALQSKKAMSVIDQFRPFCDTLDLAWQRFTECGGFPRAVGEYMHAGAVSPEFVFDLLSWLAADVEPDAPTESVSGLLAILHERLGSPLDVTNTASALSTTRARLNGRLSRLVTSFAAMWAAQGNDDGEPVENSQSKLYFLDSLLAHLPSLRDPGYSPPDMTRLTENQLAIELARSMDRLHPDRLIEQRAVMYARTGSGKEIDFAPLPIHVAGIKTRSVPVEGKWVSNNWRSSTLVMRGRYHAGILATKNIVDLSDEVWAVPAPILSLLLN